MAVCTMGSSVAWADNLIFDGTTLIWNTSEDNKSFADETDAPAAFAAGDNVSFSGESNVTLGEDISAGTVVIEKGADVTLTPGEYSLDAERIELGGTLEMGDSLSVGKDSTLAITDAGAVLDSNLVLGEKGVLSVTGAGGSLGGHSLTLQQGASLILTGAVISRETTDADQDGELSLIVTPTGDGKTYTLLTGVDVLVDKTGNALAAGSYAIDDLFDSSLPGSGFWTGGTLVYAADETLTLVRHNETVKDALEVTTRQTGNVYYSYYAGISFKNLTTTDSDGGAIYGSYSSTITLSNNGSVVFVGNTASTGSSRAYYGGAIYGYTITLSNNGSVEFVGNTASGLSSAHGGAIYGSSSTITLSNNGSVVFVGNKASSSSYAHGGAIYGSYSSSTITLSNNGSVVFVGNKASSSSYANGGAIYGCTITLSNNGSVEFVGNTASPGSSSARGGAIYGDGDITLSNNGSVEFEGNTASSYFAGSTGTGGAIHGGGDITLSNNGSVVFEGNTTSSGGGAIYGVTITLSNNGSVVFEGNTTPSGGGAIYGETITLSNNGSVVFEGNTASSGSSGATGGAIYGYTITLSNNGSVEFVGNTASSGSYSANGGAIYGYTITLSNNGSVVFEGNTSSSSTDYALGGAIDVIGESNELIITGNASGLNEDGSAQQLLFENNHTKGTGDLSGAYGGAISAGSGSTLKINNNGETIFRGNYASSTQYYADGGALYKQYGIFSIQNNASVVFEKNYTLQGETLRLQGIYAYDLRGSGDEMVVNFSAPKDGKIEFRDSIHIGVYLNSASAFHLNNWYENDEGSKIAQTGDIIFTGADAKAENLKAILAVHGINREATADEIRLSKTSEVGGTMQLHDGRLIICDGAILRATGITVHDSASGESTPTLWLDNGELGVYNGKNIVTISGGSALRLSGQNTAMYSTLTLSPGSTLIIDVAATHAATAALTLDNGTLTLDGGITLQLNAAEGLAADGRYMLLSGVSEPTDWASHITVSGGVWTIDDLSWVNNTLYLNYPTLTEATWNNASGDWVWNVDSSVNWEQHELNWAYRNGIGVIFGDEACGTVKLAGNLAPKSVLVNNSIGKDYVFSGTGSLTDSMRLTKDGTGKLTIQTSNSYTGGTEIKGGVLVVDNPMALGTGEVVLNGGTLEIAVTGLANTLANTGTSTLKVSNGKTHSLAGTIDNSGELTLEGLFDATALATAIGETHIDANGQEGNSGFLKTAGKEVDIMTGSGTLVNNGTVSIDGTTVMLDSTGYGKTGAELQLGTYTIVDGTHSVEAILGKSATADIILESGTLTADASTDALTATGGIINMSDAIELGGSISGAVLNVSAGKLMATLEGANTLNAMDWSMSQAITNNGTLTLEGTVDATILATAIGETHIDATGQEGNSGFLKTAGKEVDIMTGSGTLVNNGTVSIGGTTVTLDDKGYGKTGAELQLGTYTIVDGTHSVEAILGKSATANIILEAGTLTVDASTDALTATGGIINMSDAIELGGSISGTELNVSAGKLSATLEGANTLNATDWSMSQAITNNGTLTLEGTVDATILATAIGETHIDATGQEGNSGFLKTAGMEVDIMTGSGTLVNNGTVSIGGTTVTLDDKGYGKTGAELQLGTYTIVDGTHSVEAILRKSATANIILEAGTLTADASTNALTATGGVINMNEAIELGGSISGAVLNVSAGKLMATLEGANTLNAMDWSMSQAITNNGTLTLEGTVDATILATAIGETHIDATGQEGNSGFLKTAGMEVDIMTGSGTLVNNGTVSIDGTTVTLDDKGYGKTGAELQLGTYTIVDGTHSVEAILRKSATANIILESGTLTVDASTDALTATGGIINMSDAIELGGSISGTELNVSAGKLTATLSGENTLNATDWSMSQAITNNGTLTLEGTVDATTLATAIDETHIDATGREGNSGFLKTAGKEVDIMTGSGTLVNNGTVSIDGTTVTLDDKGYGKTGAELQLGTYTIVDGTHSVEAILRKSATANIILEAGTLTVDASTDALTATGGSIEITEAATLGGSIENTAVSTASGSYSAEISAMLKGDTTLEINGGEIIVSGDNSYTGGTTLKNGTVLAGTATALGTGGVVLNGGTLEIGATGLDNSISNTGTSTLQTSAGITHVLTGTISNTGTLTLSGSFDASALDYETNASDERYALDGSVVGADKSGFAVGVTYQVKVIDGGTTINDIATILHDSHAGSNALVLESDGYARANGDGSYSVFYLEGTDSLAVSTIAGVSSQHQETLSKVVMDSGELTVDQSISVDADGGSIVITKESTLSGSIDNTAVSTGAGDYSSTISAVMGGSSSLAVGGGNITVSGANNYSGGTEIKGGVLVATNASALGTGSVTLNGGTLEIGVAGINNTISNTGTSILQVVNGVAHVLGNTAITNSGTLTISGSFEASALEYKTETSDQRYALDGSVVSNTQSGFSMGEKYAVQIVNGGLTNGAGATITHTSHQGSNPLVLGEDGWARANGDGSFSVFYLEGTDSLAVSTIAGVSSQHQETLSKVIMDSGSLTVDQSIAVVSTGGSIAITKAATLDGSIEDTAVSTAAGSYSAEISAMLKGDTTLEINGGEITVSGANSYTGGTVVKNGGTLLAGNAQAFGTGDVVVNGATLDLNSFNIANKVVMNGSSTLGHADGASHIVLSGGSQANFRDGFTLSSGKTLEVAVGGAAYTGALTLGGGTLLLAEKLTVQGDVVFEAGKQTVIDISGWTAADDGTVLVDFGSSNSGYADGCLTLGGIAGDWELDFNTMTGVLTLVAVKEDFRPNLDRNQQEVYDTMKDIMAGGNPGGVLGQLGQNIIGTRDESELKRALDEISGREYATIMSSQIEGNLGHLRRLRASAGMGTPLGEYVRPGESVFSNKGVDKSDNKGATVLMAPSPVLDSRRIRAGVSAFHEQVEIESDSNGDGFERSETGAQLTMEYLVSNDFVLGMGLSHSRTKLTPAYGKRRDEDNTHVDLYGVYQSGSWSSITALGVGLHQHELGRTVAGMQTEAEADGLSVNFLQELAYCVYADEEQGLEVFGAVESSFNKVDSFSESGAGNASLLVDEQDAWATDVTLGLRYNHTLTSLGKAPAGMFTLQGGVVASLGDTNADATVHFAGAPGYGFKQSAAERNRWGYSVGASVNLPVSASTAVFGTAEAVLRNDSYTVDAQVGVKMAF